MPSPRPHRNRTERSKSFNGRGAVAAMEELKRPRTVPDLRAAAVAEGGGGVAPKKVLTKVLMNVNIQGSVGAVQVLVSLENTVGELISAVVKQYLKEGRRPIILVNDVVHFDLHYSQFSLECLDRDEKLAALGSRNFFMCKRRKDVIANGATDGCDTGVATTSSCSKQAEKATKFNSSWPWLKFMNFLL
ncbi:hypothetical protein RND81_14G151000 [Saponaria officinalis]|uniref:DUF7054 domain-containing protein n=1 Tax=Saponaria officinalis TaxID=3572 RepID=A0AAW1GQR4_SAPOF